MPGSRPDLGYPTPAHGRIPAFESADEAAACWDTHDITDSLDDSGPVEMTVGSDLATRLTVQIEAADRAELEHRARHLGVGPSTLARMWLKERLRREDEVEPKSHLPT